MSEPLSFGVRLRAAMQARGPVCVGIDPHPALLGQWQLADDVRGLEQFSLTVVEALADRVAVLKPQVALFERFGSRGVAVLEKVLAECAAAGVLTIADAKRGDIGSTMAAYAEAFVGQGSPLAADAVTASPFLGFGSLRPLLDLAAANGRGVFVLALTSNPEGAQVQHARLPDGRTVAQSILDAIAAENHPAQRLESMSLGSMSLGSMSLGSIGAVVGATITIADDAASVPRFEIGGPLLAPGLGAQGGTPSDLRRVFGPALGNVLASSSREVLQSGPTLAGLRAAAARTVTEVQVSVAG